MNIKEVSQLTGLSADTLRYYEKIGLIPKIKRGNGGIRKFDEDDLKWITFSRELRQAGMSIDNVLAYISLYRQPIDNQAARKQLLEDQRQLLLEKMSELNQMVSLLDNRIENYPEFVGEVEAALPCFDPSQCVAV